MTATEFKVGDLHEEVLVEDLTRTQLVMYSGASGDYNPIHTDELFTREAAGYPGVFAHGMLTMGMTGRAITNLVGAENVRKFGVRFTSQVWPGDTLTAATWVEAVPGGRRRAPRRPLGHHHQSEGGDRPHRDGHRGRGGRPGIKPGPTSRFPVADSQAALPARGLPDSGSGNRVRQLRSPKRARPDMSREVRVRHELLGCPSAPRRHQPDPLRMLLPDKAHRFRDVAVVGDHHRAVRRDSASRH